jgi:hypothetical protein
MAVYFFLEGDRDFYKNYVFGPKCGKADKNAGFKEKWI